MLGLERLVLKHNRLSVIVWEELSWLNMLQIRQILRLAAPLCVSLHQAEFLEQRCKNTTGVVLISFLGGLETCLCLDRHRCLLLRSDGLYGSRFYQRLRNLLLLLRRHRLLHDRRLSCLKRLLLLRNNLLHRRLWSNILTVSRLAKSGVLRHVDDKLLVDGPLPGVRSRTGLSGIHVVRLRQLLVVLDILLVRVVAWFGWEVGRPLLGLVAVAGCLDLCPEQLVASVLELVDELIGARDDRVEGVAGGGDCLVVILEGTAFGLNALVKTGEAILKGLDLVGQLSFLLFFGVHGLLDLATLLGKAIHH